MMAGGMAACKARRRRGTAINRMVLSLLVAAASVVALAARVEAQQCGHSTGEKLLERLEQRFNRCLGANAFPEARETLTSAFTSNEFDRQAPLALALFSNSSGALDALASAVATSLFGDRPSPHSTQVADFVQLLAEEMVGGARPSNYEVKQALRLALAAPLRSCPSRSLFVVRNVQALDDAALPVLDVFLDPLNGRRAQFQSLDCTNSVFLFLFQVETAVDADAADASGSANASRLWTENAGGRSGAGAWREFLMRRWTRPAETHAAEEFTPQALVGRLTDGLALMSYWAPAQLEDNETARNEWARACQFPLRADQDASDAAASEHAKDWAAALATPEAFVFLLAFLAVLLTAKNWNQETARKRERATRGRITRHKAKGRKTRRKR